MLYKILPYLYYHACLWGAKSGTSPWGWTAFHGWGIVFLESPLATWHFKSDGQERDQHAANPTEESPKEDVKEEEEEGGEIQAGKNSI